MEQRNLNRNYNASTEDINDFIGGDEDEKALNEDVFRINPV